MSNGKEDMTTKKCTRCKQEKETNLFSLNKKRKDGLQSWCQSCVSEYFAIKYKKEKPPSHQREYLNAYQLKWKSKPTNLEASRMRKRNNSIFYKLCSNPDSVKDETSIRNFGIDTKGLIQYFESNFEPGMNWNNYGAWQLDHQKGLVYFDLTKEENRKIANHYTNIKPAWATGKKGNLTRRKKKKRAA